VAITALSVRTTFEALAGAIGSAIEFPTCTELAARAENIDGEMWPLVPIGGPAILIGSGRQAALLVDRAEAPRAKRGRRAVFRRGLLLLAMAGTTRCRNGQGEYRMDYNDAKHGCL
jgi:hypothetical protein